MSSIIAAVWGEVWHWGLGVGLIILSLAAAYFSPIGKQFFLAFAAAVFLLLVAYGVGITNDAKLCDAKLDGQLQSLHQQYRFVPKYKPPVPLTKWF